jgi:hypothetical protein
LFHQSKDSSSFVAYDCIIKLAAFSHCSRFQLNDQDGKGILVFSLALQKGRK